MISIALTVSWIYDAMIIYDFEKYLFIFSRLIYKRGLKITEQNGICDNTYGPHNNKNTTIVLVYGEAYRPMDSHHKVPFKRSHHAFFDVILKKILNKQSKGRWFETTRVTYDKGSRLFCCHDDVIKRKHFPRYWPCVRRIHGSPVNYPHKVQWRGALMFSFICAWTHGWVKNREADDLRRYRAHYAVTVMCSLSLAVHVQVNRL